MVVGLYFQYSIEIIYVMPRELKTQYAEWDDFQYSIEIIVLDVDVRVVGSVVVVFQYSIEIIVFARVCLVKKPVLVLSIFY